MGSNPTEATMKNNSKYFCNVECEYYPCHDLSDINCLFCFCPLYTYDCGGDYVITEKGKRDCSHCILPHMDYEYVMNVLKKC